jgi:hypothetical protein
LFSCDASGSLCDWIFNVGASVIVSELKIELWDTILKTGAHWGCCWSDQVGFQFIHDCMDGFLLLDFL